LQENNSIVTKLFVGVSLEREIETNNSVLAELFVKT